MFEGTKDSDFSQLPQAMVESMLRQSDEVRDRLYTTFSKLIERRDEYRRLLSSDNLLRSDSDLPAIDSHPTACGVDGSYAVDRLISTDVIAVAGVAVEGLTPPSEKRYWPEPYHDCKVLSVQHSDATSVVLGAVMMCMELELAVKAPHDVVFLDGSLTTPLIYLTKALYEVENVSHELSALLKSKLQAVFEAYATILKAERTDKIFVGVPKYTTKKEITQGRLNLVGYEDRGFLSQIMKSGEFIGPLPIEPSESSWQFPYVPSGLRSLADEIVDSLKELSIAYYRPYRFFPTLRLEMAKSVANNSQRLAILFECIRNQCSPPGIMEPYPLYLADRMVKKLGTALPVVRRAATQEMVLQWEDDTEEMYLAMHGYRTEIGR